MQIFVLGMHRSGTSAVTRLINLLGAYVGTEDALWGASDENPKGFWERKDSQLLNQAIIESVGANWDRVSEFNIDKLADAAKTAFKGQAANILVKLEQFRPWVMKDPRLCLTFPFWQALLECPICVIPYRNPIEVAQSLRTRNGFPIPFGLALWESYLLAALKASQGVPRYFLSYNALIDNSFDEVEKLCGWLQSAGVRRLEMPSQEEVTAFLDPGLRRERSANSLLDDSLSCRQKQVFDALESRSDKAINLLTTDLSVSAAGTLRLYEDFADLSNKFPGLKKANEQKSKEIGTLRASMCNIETALSASRTRQQALEVQFESQEARISLLCNEVSAERNSRAQEVKNCEDEIKKLTVEFQTERQMSERSFKRAIERLESKLKEEEDRAKDLEIKLDDQNKASVQLASEITYRLEQMASEHCALSQERDKFLIERERLINENTAEIGRLNDRATGLMVALEVERYFTQCSAEYRRLAVRRRTALGIAKLINNLDKSIAQILKSRRWKTGNLLVGRIGRRITFQRPRSLDWLDQRRAKSMRVASEWLDSRLSYYDNIFASKELRWQQSLEDGEEKSRQLASEVASAAESCKRELDQLTGNAALLLKALEALLKSRSWRVGSFIINDVLKILFFRSRRQKNWGFEQLCTGRDQLRQFAVEVSHNTDDEKKTHVELRTSSLPAPTGRQREWRDSSQIEGKISVVIPIYDAYEETKSCLHSVLHHIHPRNEVILIDDASPDDRIWRLLEEFSSEFENVIAIRNKENIGFTRTVNKGFRIAKGDVVILNSDTEVTPMWLEKLKNAAYSRPRVATVTPLTNSGSAFAIPVNHTANNLPSFLTPNGVNALLESISTRRRPKVPTGNGFCMYIRREALDEVGYFDEDSFPRGYGEENDFCLRAAEAGYVNLIDDTTFIYHKESASFGVEKQSLIERATKRINELHPGYNAVIQDWLRNDELTELRI